VINEHPCRYCKGTRRITLQGTSFECTSCNGTGIDGDPRFLFWFMVGSAISVLAAIVYII
jgi:DnaJ-class molecular chaperone